MESIVEKSWEEMTEEDKIIETFAQINREISDKELRKSVFSRADLHQQVALFYLEISEPNLSKQNVHDIIFSRVKDWLSQEEQIRNRVHTIGVFRQHYIESIYK